MESLRRREDERLVESLGGSRFGRRRLIKRLDPLVRGPIRLALRRWPNRRMGAQDEDDLVAEVFVRLLKDDAKELKKWDAARGSLENFVSLYTRSRILDWEKREVRRLEILPLPLSMHGLPEPPDVRPGPEQMVAARQKAVNIRTCIHEKVRTSRAQRMFQLLFDRALSTDEIVEITGDKRQVVIRWRSNLLKVARECLQSLQEV